MADCDRYAPAQRLQMLRTLLAARACTLAEMMEELELSESTVRRLLRALERAGEPLVEETRDDRKKAWRITAPSKAANVRLSTSNIATVMLARRAMSFLEGTGLDLDLDDVVAKLSACLRGEDAALAKNLDKKLFDVNEHPHRYDERADDVDEMVTALLYEEPLRVRHGSVQKGEPSFRFDPYSLVLYKKGLYLAGFSHWHQRVVTMALDGFRGVERQKKERFAYPEDWDPKTLVEGAFGMFKGPVTRVRIWFAKEVSRHVRRREWHASQEIEKKEDGLILTMVVAGTTEIPSWVLGWGSKAEVLEPASLRAEIAREVAAMHARYAR